MTTAIKPFTNHVALITGGNAGIGYGIASGLLTAGADVVIAGRNEVKTGEAAARLAALFPDRRVLGVICDVADDAAVDDMIARSVKELGRVDSCFANAGITESTRAVWDLPTEDWRRIMAVNLDGAFFTLRATARHMVERGGGGALIAVSSTAAIHGAPNQPHYATAKTALLGLVRSMAVALARHQVRVNALLPGWTDTDLLGPRRTSTPFIEQTTRRTPVRRWADPAEYGPAATFLADPSITFHTGDAIVMDGGYTVC